MRSGVLPFRGAAGASTTGSAFRLEIVKKNASMHLLTAAVVLAAKAHEAIHSGAAKEVDRNTVVLGATRHPYSATLDEIEAYLTNDRRLVPKT
jgi:hypothetical protein